MMSSAIPPSFTTSSRIFIAIGVTEVIGSTPSTLTSPSCSTKAKIALSSPRRFSTSSSATEIRARRATRRTVSASTDICSLPRLGRYRRELAPAYSRADYSSQQRSCGLIAAPIEGGRRERGIFRRNADGKHSGIEYREYQRIDRQAERQRHPRNLGRDHGIVRMAKKPIGPARDQPLARDDDYADGPAPPEREQNPEPRHLRDDEKREKHGLNRAVIGQPPQSRHPRRVQQDDQQEMAPAEFDTASLE